jgi:hypothetical protein
MGAPNVHLSQRRRFVVDRNKRPALTSPWKIGFLVSLLLVTVSIGVGFAITRTFGVTWSWLHLGDGSWAFNLDAFLREMLPLVVMVPVMSLIAYFVITGAVRKYRAYLDSGVDYKHLLHSIRQIEDLDEGRIKSLGDYPELRDFLLKIRNRVGEREKALDKKESTLKAKSEQLSLADQFKAEIGVLIGAINKGWEKAFNEDLALSLPELKRMEKAIRERLLGGSTVVSMATTDVSQQLANLKVELSESNEALRQMMTEISSEMVASQNGAREIELYLSQLKTATGSSEGTEKAGVDTLGLVERLDQSAAALAALGEETRGMAINTALQAGSGKGDAKELVRLADEVRNVAAKFNTIAAQHQDVGGQLRKAVESLPAGENSGEAHEMMKTMSDRLKYWVERVIILSEKLGAFEQQYFDTTSAFESKLVGDPPGASYRDVRELVEDDLTSEAIVNTDKTGDVAASGSFPGQGAEEIALDLESTPTAGTTGLEPKKDLFEEIGGRSDDNMFADIPVNATDSPTPDEAVERTPPAERPTEAPASATTPPGAPQDASPSELFQEMGATTQPGAPPPDRDEDAPLAPQSSQSGGDTGRILRSQVDLSGVEVEGTAIPPVEQAPAGTPTAATPQVTERPSAQAKPSAPGKLDPTVVRGKGKADETVYDLYELGAVDYEPSVHQNA